MYQTILYYIQCNTKTTLSFSFFFYLMCRNYGCWICLISTTTALNFIFRIAWISIIITKFIFGFLTNCQSVKKSKKSKRTSRILTGYFHLVSYYIITYIILIFLVSKFYSSVRVHQKYISLLYSLKSFDRSISFSEVI